VTRAELETLSLPRELSDRILREMEESESSEWEETQRDRHAQRILYARRERVERERES
jgi:hypothetical protein